MVKFKISETEWEEYLPSEFKYATFHSISTVLSQVNSSITSISERINEVDRISGISYTDQSKEIGIVVSRMYEIEQYMKHTIDDVEDLLDDLFYNELNNESGAVEELQLTADKKYQTKNTIGATELVAQSTYAYTSNPGMSGQSTGIQYAMEEKDMIGFDDIFKMSNENSKHDFKNFKDLMNADYELQKKEMKDKGEEIGTFDEYLDQYINAGKFDHTVDKGWKNWASTALDSIGVVSLVSKFTGNDFITGERYTQGEKDAASLNIVFSVVGFATFGIGTGAKITGKMALTYVAGEMAAGVTAKATTQFMDEMGAPAWLQGLTSVATSLFVSKKFDKIITPNLKSVEDVATLGISNIKNIKKLGIEGVEDLAKIGFKNTDALLKAGVKNADDLLKLGIKNADDLSKLAVKSADDLVKLGVKNVDDLAKLGIKNADDLAKVGIDNAQLVFDRIKGASGADSNVFKGILKGEEIELPNVNTKKVTYTKRNPTECSQLRNKFNTNVRSDFLIDFADRNADKLKSLGFTDADIAKLKDGLVPKGYQVHHKLPLDDGGTNDLSNLVLIKNDPYHKVITNYQNSLTKGLTAGESIEVDWPIPNGDYYNGK